ncbi:uncharacterized protein MELLADRAFT_108943 [Melampsora larici-populina 98AG31]|uniref:Uncharacterized protein n=1 Tax=Melampsora larici-populina (strain 98AG31 / pathotype 3-4-7) TaxID=747676 RepID=F4RUT9_MELLP|nr:uncharacterized protein MELLADRAFT_108943 [Melampsora larici-populina 98AG31]EGG03866.1 hypothetical protein MELLADRAFT_108943 [Melampsora larici-populina 98AG31]
MSNEQNNNIETLLKTIQTESNRLIEQLPTEIPSTSEGISLLSLKNDILLSYIHHLINICALRISGPTSFLEKTGPMPNSIEQLVWLRLVMDKVRPMEGKLKYQIDKLVKKVEENAAGALETDPNYVINDPLAFRPNPAAMGFTVPDQELSSSNQPVSTSAERDAGGEIYRPPRLAPMAYPDPSTTATTSASEGPRRRPAPAPLALRELAQLSKSQPHEESTSGLGVSAAVASARARQLARMDDYEESNMIRLVTSKKESKKRRADEAAIALGGQGVTWAAGKGVGRRGGLESEFADVLGSIGRKGNYSSAKRSSNSRVSSSGGGDPLARLGKKRQKGSFEKAVKRSSNS